MAEINDVGRRAAVHAALGDPVRLAMTDALLLGDRSPGELGEHFGLSSNLLAHHLRVLEEAGLIVRARSESDRRRSYVRLLPGVLSGLGPVPRVPDAARVVFVCTRNSARSQLAAALWQRRSRLPAASAGTDPAPRVHPRALALARRHRLHLEAHATAHLRDTVRSGDLVVAVCDNAYEHLTTRPNLHWSVPDPVAAGTDEAFERAFTDLSGRVDRLAAALLAPHRLDDF
ncbi:helix-turn-helix domain-containing protein [Nonomuraea polychroma]|uniref:arsenate reductase/protein-tyrosine-phosphatase family protein n=1 Tax=Nonomuraea polychroma TaxID=46176 RepID=UPI003D8AC23A